MAINETIGLTASFTTAGGKVLSKRMTNVTINDTSKNPTYTAGFFTNNLATTPMSSVDEGGTAYIVLTTTGVPDFTYIDWEITGAGITLDDTDVSMMSGQAMVHINKYWATIKPKLDLITEGNETLKITFKRDGVIVASASIVINDTSNGEIISNEDVRFYYENRIFGNGNDRWVAGFEFIDSRIVFNGVSYPNDYTFWVFTNTLMIPTNSPVHSVFDRYNKVEAKFLVSTGQTFTIYYDFYRIFDGRRQYSTNYSEWQSKIAPHSGKTGKMSVRLYN